MTTSSDLGEKVTIASYSSGNEEAILLPHREESELRRSMTETDPSLRDNIKKNSVDFFRSKTYDHMTVKNLWKRATSKFTRASPDIEEYWEESKYALSRPKLMDDDLEIHYESWKKRVCCHKFSNMKLEMYFWSFYMDNHINTIRIVFMAMLLVSNVFGIPMDYVQKGRDAF